MDLNPVIVLTDECSRSTHACGWRHRHRRLCDPLSRHERKHHRRPSGRSARDRRAGVDRRWWRAANYLAVGQIYLIDNPLLREPLRPEHVKPRLLGHWGTTPGLTFIYAHMNRVIKAHDLNAIFITGPGHGGPALVASTYLEGSYSEVYPGSGTPRRVCGGCSANSPFRAASRAMWRPRHRIDPRGRRARLRPGARLWRGLRQPGPAGCLRRRRRRSRNGPARCELALEQFLDAQRDGTVLPILHLNGYKIAGPTVLARIPEAELRALLEGYGYAPHFVEATTRRACTS